MMLIFPHFRIGLDSARELIHSPLMIAATISPQISRNDSEHRTLICRAGGSTDTVVRSIGRSLCVYTLG